MSSKLFLDDLHQEVILFGKTFTAEQLKNAVIDSHICRKHQDAESKR